MTLAEEFELYKALYIKISKEANDNVPLNAFLRLHKMTWLGARRSIKAYRAHFQALLKELGFSDRNLVVLCLDVANAIADDPQSETLKKLYCMLVTDCGLLLENGNHSKEEEIRNYVKQKERSEILLNAIQEEPIFLKKLESLKKNFPKKWKLMESCPEETEAIYQYSLGHDFLYRTGNKRTIYKENLCVLIRMLNEHSILRAVKPYFLFAVLTRKTTKMTNSSYYVPNLENVLEFQDYSGNLENPKNVNKYLHYVELYLHLRAYYLEDSEVDLAFSDYCFANLSTLSELYYLKCEPNEAVPVSFLRQVAIQTSQLFPTCFVDYRLGDFSIDAFAWNFPEYYKKLYRAIVEDSSKTEAFLLHLYQENDAALFAEEICSAIVPTAEIPFEQAQSAAIVLLYEESMLLLHDKMIDAAKNWQQTCNFSLSVL